MPNLTYLDQYILSQDETWQMYNAEWGPCPIRFGSSYNTINEG